MGKDTADFSDINSQVCQYKEGKELFNRPETGGCLEENARFGIQSTSDSIYSLKRRYCVANGLAEKLVHIHGNLRNIENSKEIQNSEGH